MNVYFWTVMISGPPTQRKNQGEIGHAMSNAQSS